MHAHPTYLHLLILHTSVHAHSTYLYLLVLHIYICAYVCIHVCVCVCVCVCTYIYLHTYIHVICKYMYVYIPAPCIHLFPLDTHTSHVTNTHHNPRTEYRTDFFLAITRAKSLLSLNPKPKPNPLNNHTKLAHTHTHTHTHTHACTHTQTQTQTQTNKHTHTYTHRVSMGLPGPLGHGFGTPPLDTRLPPRLNRSVRPLVDIQLPAGGLFFFFGTGAHKKRCWH